MAKHATNKIISGPTALDVRMITPLTSVFRAPANGEYTAQGHTIFVKYPDIELESGDEYTVYPFSRLINYANNHLTPETMISFNRGATDNLCRIDKATAVALSEKVIKAPQHLKNYIQLAKT